MKLFVTGAAGFIGSMPAIFASMRPCAPVTDCSMLPDTSMTIAAASPSRGGGLEVGASCSSM